MRGCNRFERKKSSFKGNCDTWKWMYLYMWMHKFFIFFSLKKKDGTIQIRQKEFTKCGLHISLPKYNRCVQIVGTGLCAPLSVLPTGTNVPITVEDAFKNLFLRNTTTQFQKASQGKLISEVLSVKWSPLCYAKKVLNKLAGVKINNFPSVFRVFLISKLAPQLSVFDSIVKKVTPQ